MKTLYKSVCLVLALTLLFTSCTSKSEAPETPPQPDITLANKEEPLSGSLRVSAYDSMEYKDYLEEAAEKFMKLHPDTLIEVETFSSMPVMNSQGSDDGSVIAASFYEEDPQGESDYITRTNTQLMSGKGADVYAMDVLPIQSYIQQNQLENLTPYMEQDPEFVKEDYQQHILEKSKVEQGNYFFPLAYDFSYFAYDKSLLPTKPEALGKDSYTLQELLDAKESISLEKEEKLLSSSKEQVANLLFKESLGDFVDFENKTVNFTSGDFENLLEFVQQLENEDYLAIDNFSDLKSTEEQMKYFEEMQSKRYLYKPQNSGELFLLIPTKENSLSFGGFGGNTKDDIYGWSHANSKGQVEGEITNSVAINKNSENKALAWEFIKFLASEEMQSSLQFGFSGQAIRNSSRKNYLRSFFNGSMWGEEIEITPELQKEIDKALEQIDESSNSVGVIPLYDPVFMDIVRGAIDDYYTGKSTPKEVISTLQTKATLYLNE